MLLRNAHISHPISPNPRKIYDPSLVIKLSSFNFLRYEEINTGWFSADKEIVEVRWYPIDSDKYFITVEGNQINFLKVVGTVSFFISFEEFWEAASEVVKLELIFNLDFFNSKIVTNI
jgi:hypothetical protein